MLAQNFKTAVDLGINDVEWTALVKVLGMLERGEIKPEMFNIHVIGAPDCGSAGCICGWARSVSPVPVFTIKKSGFQTSFGTAGINALFIRPRPWDGGSASPAQAAVALRNYLTTGEARWEEAMAS